MSTAADDPGTALRAELRQLRTDLDAARRMTREIEANAPAGNAGRRVREAADAANRRLASARTRLDDILQLVMGERQ